MTGSQPEERPEPCRLRKLIPWFIVLVLVVCTGCGDYSVELPGGYRLSRVYAGAVHITRPEHRGIAINANIDRYAVVDHIVVGHVSQAVHEFERSLSVPGYFLLDTSTGQVMQGLDPDTWRARLEEAGIDEIPSLGEPSRWD